MNLQATKQQSTVGTKKKEVIMNYFSPSREPNGGFNEVVYIFIDMNHPKTAYPDLMGRFAYKSGKGNEYILVGYHYDTNCT